MEAESARKGKDNPSAKQVKLGMSLGILGETA